MNSEKAIVGDAWALSTMTVCVGMPQQMVIITPRILIGLRPFGISLKALEFLRDGVDFSHIEGLEGSYLETLLCQQHRGVISSSPTILMAFKQLFKSTPLMQPLVQKWTYIGCRDLSEGKNEKFFFFFFCFTRWPNHHCPD